MEARIDFVFNRLSKHMEHFLEAVWGIIQQKRLNILWIIILFFIGKGVLRWLVNKATALADDGDDATHTHTEKQTGTLGGIVTTTGNVVIYIVILLMLLDLFNVDITPVLAGVGIAGLAVGFGAQALVKDFVSGLFVFLEHQYHVGDRIKLADFEGTVRRISMRSTVIQDDEGRTFYISNGTVNKVVNYSQKDYNWKS